MFLSQNISYLLKRDGLKKNFLAELLDVTPTQATRYANGKSIPPMPSMVKLAELFDVNLQDLVMLDLSKEPGRPFVGSDVEAAEENILELNELLRQRVAVLERELKRQDPELARELGIK